MTLANLFARWRAVDMEHRQAEFEALLAAGPERESLVAVCDLADEEGLWPSLVDDTREALGLVSGRQVEQADSLARARARQAAKRAARGHTNA